MTAQQRAAALEAYVSVDVETAGPYPGQYSMLSIGACLVADRQRTFYCANAACFQGGNCESLETR
jgi:hypothetical protein